jgi:tetratricopeptide (TPR) repeat protein
MKPKKQSGNNFLDKALKLHRAGNLSEAINLYQELIKKKPDDATLLFLYGTAMHQVGNSLEGIALLYKSLKIQPNNHHAYNNIGNALKDMNHFEEAINCYDLAIGLRPNYAEAINNKGVALTKLSRFDEAIICYFEAIKCKSDYAEPHNNIANIYIEQKKTAEALTFYNNAIAIDKNYVSSYCNKSLLKLLLGEYDEGWKLYEWRWRHEAKKLLKHVDAPLWSGNESLANKTIYVYYEQGLGDTIQFCRYIKLLADLGAKVIFKVQKQLIETLRNIEGVHEVIVAESSLPKIDFHSPLLSLPLAFKTSVDTIPNQLPYIKANPTKVEHWSKKLGEKVNIRVGLVWSGGFRPDQPELWEVNKRRNLALDYLQKLNVPGVDFFSLQKGEPAESEFVNLNYSKWGGPLIKNYVDELQDFSDTSALIENLDLVISVDTSTAHMAAAMGKQVWLLNRYDTCWRWFLDRSDSPWYPTVRIFRQPSPGDWDSVINEVKISLEEKVSTNQIKH